MSNYVVAKLASIMMNPFLDVTVSQLPTGGTNNGGTSVNDLGPLQTIRLLGSLVLALVSGIGAVVLGFEIYEFAVAIKRSDPNAKSDAVKGIVAGSIMFFVGGILSFLGFQV